MNGEIFKKNMQTVRRLREKAAALTVGELCEAVYCVNKSDEKADYSALFAKYFDCELLSPEFALFCKALVESGTESGTESESECSGVIAYLGNSYSEAALTQLLAKHPLCTAEAVSDFRSCAEAVSQGRCEYCLMPLCSTEDGHFQSFRRLIRTNELKTIDKVTVSPADTDNEMQFALLSKSCTPLVSTQYLDFSFVPKEDSDFAALCGALNAVGAVVCTALSSPLEYNIDKSEFYLTVKLAPDTAPALAIFLENALPASSVDGAY